MKLSYLIVAAEEVFSWPSNKARVFGERKNKESRRRDEGILSGFPLGLSFLVSVAPGYFGIIIIIILVRLGAIVRALYAQQQQQYCLLLYCYI